MFDQTMARIAGRFGRVEPRATARAYLRGLLSNAERKNCRQTAEQAGHARPGPMQRLLRYARWDADAVRDDLRAYAAEHLGTDDAVLIVDETGPEAARMLRPRPLSAVLPAQLLRLLDAAAVSRDGLGVVLVGCDGRAGLQVCDEPYGHFAEVAAHGDELDQVLEGGEAPGTGRD
ncbi:transposase [Streptomyces sp. A012304]|uniref:transposase n=1 Tax=Streptomyces sp. A012304 TaxID=375446 RepID=UPI0035D447C7